MMTQNEPLSEMERQIEIIARGTSEIVPMDELKAKLRKAARDGRPLQIKLGLDPTAPDIHLGNAVVLRKLRQFQDLGHQVTVIIGDFTAMIGDPTGKSETRKQLSPEEVQANAKTYAEQYHKILDPPRTRVVFNSEWLGKLGLYELTILLAKTTVARILERDDFAGRFQAGQPIHTHELLYPICQGYDSVHLRSDVELGGTEQRFNIMMGRDLQREHGLEPQVALFMPLLVGLDGTDKMSKSKGNAIGIDEKPWEMFGKIMSISDPMMPSYFELCTDVPLDEVRVLTDPDRTHPRAAKKRLAREVVTIYHGAQAAAEADALFERIVNPATKLTAVPDVAPDFVVPADLLDAEGQCRVVDLLVRAALAPSSGQAKRLIEQGGVAVNGERIQQVQQTVQVRTGQAIRVGKARFVRLVVPAGDGRDAA